MGFSPDPFNRNKVVNDITNEAYDVVKEVRDNLDHLLFVKEQGLAYQVALLPPVTRIDGTSLEIGDRYFDTTQYIYTWTQNNEWVLAEDSPIPNEIVGVTPLLSLIESDVADQNLGIRITAGVTEFVQLDDSRADVSTFFSYDPNVGIKLNATTVQANNENIATQTWVTAQNYLTDNGLNIVDQTPSTFLWAYADLTAQFYGNIVSLGSSIDVPEHRTDASLYQTFDANNDGTGVFIIRDGSGSEALRIDQNFLAAFSGDVTGANLNIANWDTAFGWGNHALGGYEPGLGNPLTDGYVLSSTTAGVRSWVAHPITVDAPNDTNEYVRKNNGWVINTGGTAGGGDVFISGTPVTTHIAVWNSGNSIEGDADLTWDGINLDIAGNPVATQSWVTSQGYLTGGPYLPITGGTLTGDLQLPTSGKVRGSGDDSRILLAGSNTASIVNGAYITLEGNDYGGVGTGGDIFINSGNEATSAIYLQTGGQPRLTVNPGGGITIGSNSVATVTDLQFTDNCNIATTQNMNFYIDSDNNLAANSFNWYHDAGATTGADLLMSLNEAGNLELGGNISVDGTLYLDADGGNYNILVGTGVTNSAASATTLSTGHAIGFNRIYEDEATLGWASVVTVKSNNTRGFQLAYQDNEGDGFWYRYQSTNGTAWGLWSKVASEAFVTSQGYVTGGPFLPLTGGTVTGNVNVQPSTAGQLWTPNARTVATFDSNNANGTTLSIISPSTGISGIYFGDTASEAPGQIKYDHAEEQFKFYVANGDKLLLSASRALFSGNVEASSFTVTTQAPPVDFFAVTMDTASDRGLRWRTTTGDTISWVPFYDPLDATAYAYQFDKELGYNFTDERWFCDSDFAINGNAVIASTNPVLTIDASGQGTFTIDSVGDSNFRYAENGVNKFNLFYDQSAGSWGVYDNTAGSATLTLDSSQNATFSGQVISTERLVAYPSTSGGFTGWGLETATLAGQANASGIYWTADMAQLYLRNNGHTGIVGSGDGNLILTGQAGVGGDLTLDRGNGTSAIYLNSSGTEYLYHDGTTLNIQNDGNRVNINGKKVLAAQGQSVEGIHWTARTASTGASNSGQWTKFARVTITSQYDSAGFSGIMAGTEHGNPRNIRSQLNVWVKQQAAFGTDPYVDVRNIPWANRDNVYNDVGYVIVQNTPTTIVDLYFQVNTAYHRVEYATTYVQPSGGGIEWYDEQAYAASVAGLVEVNREYISTFHGIYSSGGDMNTYTTPGTYTVNDLAIGWSNSPYQVFSSIYRWGTLEVIGNHNGSLVQIYRSDQNGWVAWRHRWSTSSWRNWNFEQHTSTGGSSLFYSTSAKLTTTSGGVAVTGALTATGDITAYFSDDRLKDRIENIPDALNKIATLNGFRYKPSKAALALDVKNEEQVGLSAQEVNKVLPEAIAPAPIDEQYLAVKYDKVIPLLVEAIKELKSEIEELKNGYN